MRFGYFLIGFLTATPLLFAQLDTPAESPMSPREDAIEQLLSERESKEALDGEIVKARKVGVSEQAILEARFLFHVDREEDAEIAELLPIFIKQRENFKLEDSEIFASEDDWLAVVEYVHAIAAIRKGDNKKFKQHITEAFWLSPRQGAAFASHIDRLRLNEAMKNIRIDLAKSYNSILDNNSASLREMISGKRGLLLHFWSPLSRECEATLPDFFVTAEYLLKNDIAVASILPETSEKIITSAKEMLIATGKNISGNWIVDSKQSAVSIQLKVPTVPIVVLIAPDGSVVFNGHPTNDEFWKALKKLNQEIERPELHD